jgi:hypothetical protein
VSVPRRRAVARRAADGLRHRRTAQAGTLGLDAELAILRFSNPAQAADALNSRLIAAFVD